MKNILITSLALLSIVLLPGCIQDKMDVTPCDTHVIKLSMSEMPVVESRSMASTNECWIDDAYLLVFNSGTFRTGEKVTVKDNGSPNITITTKLQLQDGETIVVLCNTGITSMPSISASATPDDINSYFDSGNWNINNVIDSGKGMPMSGTMVWNTSYPNDVVPMYRSIAKIQLQANITEDITNSFNDGSVTWGLYNVARDGNIYSKDGGISTPTFVSFINDIDLPYRLANTMSASEYQRTRYTLEYPNATMAGWLPVASSEFNSGRTCLIVHTAAGYYRLDLLTGNAYNEKKTFLNINRNHHYIVNVTKVSSAGYPTAEEALANPASNIEYDILINDTNVGSVTSNGQYWVKTDKSKIIIPRIEDGAIEDMVYVTCGNNGIGDVTTRIMRLVTSKDALSGVNPGLVSMFSMELWKQGSSLVLNNTGTFSASDDSGMQLRYHSLYDTPFYETLATPAYLEIVYGNIHHYVPIVLEDRIIDNKPGGGSL